MYYRKKKTILFICTNNCGYLLMRLKLSIITQFTFNNNNNNNTDTR